MKGVEITAILIICGLKLLAVLARIAKNNAIRYGYCRVRGICRDWLKKKSTLKLYHEISQNPAKKEVENTNFERRN